MLHASGDTDGVLFEEAADLLGRLESQVTAGGKLSRTNERERQPGRTDTFRAQEGLFRRMSIKCIAMVGSKLIQ